MESAEAPALARPPLVRRRSLLASRPNKSPRPALPRRARSFGWGAAGPERVGVGGAEFGAAAALSEDAPGKRRGQ